MSKEASEYCNARPENLRRPRHNRWFLNGDSARIKSENVLRRSDLQVGRPGTRPTGLQALKLQGLKPIDDTKLNVEA